MREIRTSGSVGAREGDLPWLPDHYVDPTWNASVWGATTVLATCSVLTSIEHDLGQLRGGRDRLPASVEKSSPPRTRADNVSIQLNT